MRFKPARLARAGLLAGATAALAGASVLGAAAALASPIGSGPGLVLSPASGLTTMSAGSVTYNSPACPSGFQGSAVVRAVNSDGTTYNVSGASNSVAAAFSGTLLNTVNMAAVRDNGDIGPGGTQEIVVQCFSGVSGAGSVTSFVDTFIAWSADGTSWAVGTAPAGAATTTTTLTASPNPANTNATVTLTAHVTASGGSTPAGTVTFSTGGSAIGSPVTVNSAGTATTTDSFTTGGPVTLTAAFTPSDTTKWKPSTSAPFTENVIGGLSEPLQVTVGTAGTFNVTVTTGTVTLTPDSAQATATGQAQPVNVFDNRNNFPGWSVSGQAVDFTESTSPKPGKIPATDLGWTPTGTLTDATLGPVVAPGATGLSTAQVWASAAAGHGNTAAAGDNISANFLLDIPSGSPAATYSSALSISFTTAGA
jgi:hypothetical protein